MIVRLAGTLESLEGQAATLAQPDGTIAREVLLTAWDAGALADQLGTNVTLHTTEYHEASGQGGHLTPRLLGFLNPADRRFFDLLTTVKGFGPRKTLRAMARPVGEIAAAIARRDAAWLTQLPEIGKRSAETICTALHDRVGAFAHSATAEPTGRSAPSSPPPAAQQAIDALIRLGEPRADAERLVDRAVESDASLDTPDAILAAAFALRS